MAPKATKAKAASKAASAKAAPAAAKAKAKAKEGPRSPAAGSAAAAVRQSRSGAAVADDDPKVAKAERMLRLCLEETEIARVDGRVLDIAVSEARVTDGVDGKLVALAEARLEEVRAFEAELKKAADELRTRKDAAIEQHNTENEAFADAYEARQQLKKEIEALFDAVGDGDLGKVRRFVDKCMILEEGTPSPPPMAIDVEDHDGNTPLSEAACYGEVEIVDQDACGESPPPSACWKRRCG
ncbi:unnamed protein product, partial [Prorocentrum cordatum]